MNKRIYISEDENKFELELSWSEHGIHLDIGQSDNTYLASLVFTENDIDTLIEELNDMKSFYHNSLMKNKTEINC